MYGSWAGATGMPQFMPSAFLDHAVDFDGDGIADIWCSVPDSLASIASFLHNHGWSPGTPIALTASPNSATNTVVLTPDASTSFEQSTAQPISTLESSCGILVHQHHHHGISESLKDMNYGCCIQEFTASVLPLQGNNGQLHIACANFNVVR